MDKTPPKTDIELLSEISGLLPTTIEANYQWVLEAMTAAREEGRREGAIGFAQFTSIMGFQMIVEHKSGICYFFNGANKFNVDEVYDLYIQSLQKDKP